MEFLKIVALSVLAAMCYGVAHDQVTARICVEYFTVFHPPVFVTGNPTLLGFGWGIIATWWMGAFLGVLLAIAARVGRPPKLTCSSLFHPIAILLAAMAIGALCSGLTGCILSRHGTISPPWWVRLRLPQGSYNAFVADWWAHNASYAVAGFGGVVLCIAIYRKRAGLAKSEQL